MKDEIMRDKFEAWARNECLSTHRHESGEYSNERTMSAFLAWKSALLASKGYSF